MIYESANRTRDLTKMPAPQPLPGGHYQQPRYKLDNSPEAHLSGRSFVDAMTIFSSLTKYGAFLLAVLALSGCINTTLGRLEVVNARVNLDDESLELLVARESTYKVEPSIHEARKTFHYALYVVHLPAADRSADWNSLGSQSRKIVSFNGPPPKDMDYYYAAGTLFTQQSAVLQWCAVQPDNTCKPIGEVPLVPGDRRVAHDRDGRHFFAAHQLFATDRAQPLLKVAVRPGYQQFVGGQLDRPMLVAHRWLLAASHRTQQPGAPILHIYDLEHDTVEPVLAQALPQRGLPELLAIDKDEQGW